MTAISFDPFSDAQRENPYPAYAELRREHAKALDSAEAGLRRAG